MIPATIHLNNAQVAFGDHVVLDLPAWSLTSPGLHLVVGPNGSGKSTLLKVIAGFQALTSGAIRHGADSSGFDFGTVQFVPDRPLLMADLSIRENAGYISRVQRDPSLVGRFLDTLDALSMTELLDRFPRQLSLGQTQRCHLALGLSTATPIVCLDEPLTGIDAPSQLAVRDVLVQQATTRIVVVASHNQLLIDAADSHLDLERHTHACST